MNVVALVAEGSRLWSRRGNRARGGVGPRGLSPSCADRAWRRAVCGYVVELGKRGPRPGPRVLVTRPTATPAIIAAARARPQRCGCLCSSRHAAARQSVSAARRISTTARGSPSASMLSGLEARALARPARAARPGGASDRASCGRRQRNAQRPRPGRRSREGRRDRPLAPPSASSASPSEQFCPKRGTRPLFSQ
jgi:hypothetical protein